jgi:hypothetical protein
MTFAKAGPMRSIPLFVAFLFLLPTGAFAQKVAAKAQPVARTPVAATYAGVNRTRTKLLRGQILGSKSESRVTTTVHVGNGTLSSTTTVHHATDPTQDMTETSVGEIVKTTTDRHGNTTLHVSYGGPAYTTKVADLFRSLFKKSGTPFLVGILDARATEKLTFRTDGTLQTSSKTTIRRADTTSSLLNLFLRRNIKGSSSATLSPVR